MIIYAAQPGQLGNSLIIYANFLAYQSEHNTRFYYPGFYDYKDYFEFTAGKNYSRFTFRIINFLARLFARLRLSNVKSIDWHESINLDESPFTKKNNTLFLLGWNYRGNKILSKNSETIRQSFTPGPKYRARLEDFFKTHFPVKNETVIGLHIRRGDYSWHEGGKYFYSIEQYKAILLKVNSLFQGHKIHFLIASNEMLQPETFADLGLTITLAPGHELLDMYSFARCNYIVGPPSTYTMWASFHGKVPLYMIHNIDKEFSITDFKIQNDF